MLRNDLHPRRHVILPTVAEVAQGFVPAYSDHVPILVQHNNINIISLNTLGPALCSGVHPKNTPEETDDEAQQRYRRIALGLAQGAALYDVGVIVLQETIVDLIAPSLKNCLGEDWEFVSERADMVTCYHKRKYRFVASDCDDERRICTVKLADADDNEFNIHNIWGVYNPFPHHMENSLREFFRSQEKIPSIIIGDFNSRIAPLDAEPRNITTTVVPQVFNEKNGAEENVQVSDFPDGAFYVSAADNFQQLEIETLNFDDGRIRKDRRLKDVVQPWPQYRMTLALDDSWLLNKCVNGQTIFEFEEELQKHFKGIRISPAANSFNEKAIGIQFPRNLREQYKQIQKQLINEDEFEFKYIHDDKKGVAYPCLFVPLNKIPQLQAAVQAVLNPQEDVIELRDHEEVDTVDSATYVSPSVYHRPLRNILIGAAVGLVVAGIIVAGAASGGGLPLVFGVVGAVLFGVTHSAAILAGIAVVTAASVALVAAVSAGIGYGYATYQAKMVQRKNKNVQVVTWDEMSKSMGSNPLLERMKASAENEKENTQQNKSEKRDTVPSITKSGHGFLRASVDPRRAVIEEEYLADSEETTKKSRVSLSFSRSSNG
jgi:hypothetical protein